MTNTKDIQNKILSRKNTKTELHRVLCVDDEPAICFAYGKLLEKERFGFDICESVESAQVLLKIKEYFAVISDVRFTGSSNEDGVHFVSVVQKEQPQAKVILVTGYGSEELERTAYILGASHYFEKPVKPAIILELLNKLHLELHEQIDADYGNLLLESTETVSL